MARPFQKRYANEVVGIFVLLTLAILVAAVALGPSTQRWLTPTRKLRVRLPPEGSLGLRSGADVLILGSVVGSVDDISVSDEGQMEAQVSIRGNFIRFVKRDSTAVIRKPLGIGDASIEITRGTAESLPLTGAVIPSSADKAPTQMLEETMADIRTQIIPAIQELRGAVKEYTQLAADLRAQQPGITQAISHFNQITGDVQAGKGVAGMLVSDPAAAETLRASLPAVKASIDDIRATAADMRKLSATLPQLRQSAQRSVDEAPQVLLQIDETTRELQHLIQALQHNVLLTGGGTYTAPDARIGADRVGTDR
jgi:phospholipid/cholesterol/gamma-HCH transport system substrate-binding protein